ncbi:MAG TPA: magnesium chelatase subunit D [Rhodopila sp.]|nr:magnesium chelatase subunit D [Rhodopila sp.]
MSGAAAWADALRALALFAADPGTLGGIAVRAGAGPVRDRFLLHLRESLPPGTPIRHLPLHVGDDRLLGGLDLPATLQAGKPVAQRGLLAEADGGVVVLAMAERVDDRVAVRLRAALDDGVVLLQRDGLSRVEPSRFGMIALDEGCEAEERPPESLLDRLAFHVDLTQVSLRDMMQPPGAADARQPAGIDAAARGPDHEPGDTGDAVGAVSARAVAPARTVEGRDAIEALQAVETSEAIETLCHVTGALGIASLRAPMLALRAARAAASQAGRTEITEPDLATAARLVLAPRARQLPNLPDSEAPEPPPPPEPSEEDDPPSLPDQPLSDVVLDAAKAALPPDLLARLMQADAGRGQARTPGRAGQIRMSVKRGRPIGTRQGEPRNGARLHLLETLKAAAPWQALRQGVGRFAVRREDFRIVRFRQRLGTTTVFAVDASGSAAMHRLAEAKGAVELLLADCYVRRDQVALIAFRGQEATVLLPPTGSLLRAKRSLAALPGGGATPLAAGIEAAAHLADGIRRSGRTPVIAVLTDARANVARVPDAAGAATGRAAAEADALDAARVVARAGISALLVDTSPRPNPFAHRLADAMQARYVPLPHAEAGALSRAVRAASAA